MILLGIIELIRNLLILPFLSSINPIRMDSLYLYLHANRWAVQASLFEVNEQRCKLIGSSRKSNIFYPLLERVELGLCSELLELKEQSEISNCNFQSDMPSFDKVSEVELCRASFSPLLSLCCGIIGDGGPDSIECAEYLALSLDSPIAFRTWAEDGLSVESRLNLLADKKPQLIFLCSNQSDKKFLKLLDELKISLKLLWLHEKPILLFCGPNFLHQQVQQSFYHIAKVVCIHPFQTEDLQGKFTQAQFACSQAIREFTLAHVPDLAPLHRLSEGNLNLFMLDYQLGMKMFCQRAGINNALGVTLGLNEVNGALLINNQIAAAASSLWNASSLEYIDEAAKNIAPKILSKLSVAEIQDILCNKAIMPWTIPTTDDELALDWALNSYLLNQLRLKLQLALKSNTLFKSLPQQVDDRISDDLFEWLPVEALIIHPNQVYSQLSVEQRLLSWLDGLQPIGFCVIYEDNHSLLSATGSLAFDHQFLSNNLLNDNPITPLCAVVSPLSNATAGTPILRLKIVFPIRLTMFWRSIKVHDIIFPVLLTNIFKSISNRCMEQISVLEKTKVEKFPSCRVAS
jgi:hypothetical protein